MNNKKWAMVLVYLVFALIIGSLLYLAIRKEMLTFQLLKQMLK